MESTEILNYKNVIGQEIKKGDWVVYPCGYKRHSLNLAKVSSIWKNGHRWLMIVQVGSQSWRGYSIIHRRLQNVMAVMKVDINSMDLNFAHNRSAKILKAITDLEDSLK